MKKSDEAIYYAVVWQRPRAIKRLFGKQNSTRVYQDGEKIDHMPESIPAILPREMQKRRKGTITWWLLLGNHEQNPGTDHIVHIGAYGAMLDRVTLPALGRKLGE